MSNSKAQDKAAQAVSTTEDRVNGEMESPKMADKPTERAHKLPEDVNPMLQPSHTPQMEILIERRKLAQTNLSVKPGQQDLTSATERKNLGKLDYVHLRAPLPKNLQDAVLHMSRDGSAPGSYFLMRRSSDGYISATGMFKAAFPWATKEEFDNETSYLKDLGNEAEVAGNVWVAPEVALKLAKDYSMRPWIQALLSNESVDPRPEDMDKEIASPPPFFEKEVESERETSVEAPSIAGRTRKNARGKRGATPSALESPRKYASPRKRGGRGSARGGSVRAASTSLQDAIGQDDIQEGTAAQPEANGDSVIVEVTTTTEREDNIETTRTHAAVHMPTGHEDLPLPEDPLAMLEKARQMVEEANKLESRRISGSKSSKRKADEIEEDEDEDGNKQEVQPAKKTRLLQEDLKKERVKTRALIGIGALSVVGFAIPFLNNFF